MSEEARVGFLSKAAASLPQSDKNLAQTILKSYYLMRCRDVAKDHGLPDKYFSTKVRCSRCFVEWKRDTTTKVHAIKLSKRQRRKIKHYKITNNNKDYVKNRKNLLNSNELEQTCSFCKHCTTTPFFKPSKPKLQEKPLVMKNDAVKDIVKKVEIQQTKHKKVKTKAVKQTADKTAEVNVYSKAKDVFSLTNKNNTLPSTVKEQKVIKNNKRKKDKFAGLCQQAVLASAKLKQEKDKQNKLNLFLKPFS